MGTQKIEFPFTLKVEVNSRSTGWKISYLEMLWIKEALESQYKDLKFESKGMEESYHDLIVRINYLMKVYNTEIDKQK